MILYSISLRIKKENNKNILKIGNKGTFAFITDYNDSEKNIFKNINMIFNNKIIDENKNEYEVECKFWKPSDENIRIFCKLNNDLKNFKQNIILNKYSFYLNNNKIDISQEDYIEAEFYNHDIPFLYSDKVIKNYMSITNNLTLSFQVESYFNDLLYIFGQHNNYEILDNCTLNAKMLNCLITAEKIHELVIYNNEIYKIGFIHDELGLIPFENILGISLNDTSFGHIELYVGITKLINMNTEIGAYYGYETNVTSPKNFITDYMNDTFDSCFMKKSTNKPLLIFCKALKEYSGTLTKSITKEIVYENIHYFYHLRIQPFQINENMSIKGYGTDVKLIYPEILDFTKNYILTIRYLMTDPNLATNIKLSSGLHDLSCINLNGMKKCEITKDYFLGENYNNFYDTYHLNHEGNLVIYNEINSIKVILSKEDSLNIFVLDKYNNQEIKIGQNGIIYFITNYTDKINIFDSSDIEEKTEFKTTITDNNKNNYNVTCRLWKPNGNYFRIFCKLDKNIILQNIFIKINSASFTYDRHKIKILSLMDYSIKLNTFDTNMPFIYSDKQTIDINKEYNFYEIKFKLLEYNNEQLILFNKGEELSNIFLDNCDLNGKNLSCKITREKIVEILGHSGQNFVLKYFDNNLGLLFDFNNVFDIILNYTSIQKEIIYIGITKLLEKNISMNDYITYETNITSISNIISNKFIFNKNNKEIPCFIKKTKDKPLLILCKIMYKGELSLGEIKEEIKLDNINIKYNLLIQPIINNEVFTSRGDGASILFSSPTLLDFYLKDSFTIYFYSNEINNLIGIKLNPDSNTDLKCTLLNNIKKCIIDKSHLEGKQSGDYYVYHKNYLDEYIISYELSPLQVILPESKEIIIKITKKYNPNEKQFSIGKKGVLYFITDSNDSKNFFDSSDIEEKTLNNVTFISHDNNYSAQCHLWKPKEQKMKLICKFNEIINDKNIKLNQYSFDYKENKIVILFEDYFNILQLNSSIASLYSDKQVININDSINDYNLIFKKEIYNKEPLILYKEDSLIKNIYLNCDEQTKEIKCSIKKDILIEILSYSREKFNLCHLTDAEGLLKFNDVFDITINYDNIIKKDIYINIEKIIDMNKNSLTNPWVELNSFIYYETNVTDIPKITTSYFEIKAKSNQKMKCLFKKNNNDKLLLLCNADSNIVSLIDLSDNININTASIQYNFIIAKNNQSFDYFISGNKGTKVLSVIPDTLDFNSQNKLIIKYITSNPEKLEHIKLNNDSSSELECINKNFFKECNVYKDNFSESGDYYSYHNNSYGVISIIYEIPKINVLFQSENENKDDKEKDGDSNLVWIIVGSVIGGLIIIAIVIFFVVKYYRRKNSDLNIKDNNLSSIMNQVELTEKEIKSS